MNQTLEHTTQDFTASLPADRYIAVYRDARRFAACCRACPNYGRSWACPPFDFDMEDYLSGYRTALIIASKDGGRAFAYAGTCLYCPEGSCTRLEGKACRHPEWVRPSLEACGFDLSRTVEELMGIPLRWGEGDRMPEYLTLVSGFFHNAERIDLTKYWEE